ncbi:hypothetical protein EK21DRAFT_62694 [Setomelanomma holmii]|uniref:MYND-type domain-containing protein n=1 Tax=Setomelanomma holmii TaxID=210430 RepID=A0A9P4LLM2_9PLEO|nr:hypothetical protein EK21DRAFT_62694 [Setomelanomma holmii]
MDTAQYIQQCAQEDQAGLDEYIASRPAESSTAADQLDYDYLPRSPRSLPPQTFHVSTNLVCGCVTPGCAKTHNLNRCSVCKVVQYCSREHQAADRRSHRSVCGKIKKAQANLEYEEEDLRQEEGDGIFGEGGRGHFWRTHETRDYMRARYTLVEALLKINAFQAVSAALDHLLDMLELCRSDNLGARDVIPGLYIRLGRDQEAYDFCKWWATTGQENDYDWDSTGLPYLDVKNADVFEEVGAFVGAWPSLAHNVAITLLKVRLMMDLQSLQQARLDAGPHVPQEILDTIQQHTASSIITGRSEIVNRVDQTPHIMQLQKQVKELHAAVHKANPYFWPALLKPGDNLKARPTSYGFGDMSHMQLVLQYTYNAWAETPGAISAIGELLKA